MQLFISFASMYKYHWVFNGQANFIQGGLLSWDFAVENRLGSASGIIDFYILVLYFVSLLNSLISFSIFCRFFQDFLHINR